MQMAFPTFIDFLFSYDYCFGNIRNVIMKQTSKEGFGLIFLYYKNYFFRGGPNVKICGWTGGF